MRKKKFMVAVMLRSMEGDAFLVNEEVEANYFDFTHGLQFYDLDDLGEPIYRACFRKWLYVKEIPASESGDESKHSLKE